MSTLFYYFRLLKFQVSPYSHSYTTGVSGTDVKISVNTWTNGNVSISVAAAIGSNYYCASHADYCELVNNTGKKSSGFASIKFDDGEYIEGSTVYEGTIKAGQETEIEFGKDTTLSFDKEIFFLIFSYMH